MKIRDVDFVSINCSVWSLELYYLLNLVGSDSVCC